MKKLFIFLVTLFAFCLNWAGCSGGGDGEAESQSSITLSKSELGFDSNTGFQTIVVTSSDDWTVAGGADWCNISSSSGSTGATITITVDANSTDEDRSAIFTFSCGKQSAKLTIIQYGIIETSYVDLRLEKEETEFVYNEQNGEIVITYTDTSVPQIEIGQSFVLNEKHGHAIRKITASSKSGKKVTLQTEPGDMCDLFRNIDFTLTTNPDLVASKASTGRGITPTSIEMIVDGKRTTIYEKSEVMSRDVFEYEHEIFRLDDDLEDEKLAEGNWGTLKWQKCKYDIGLDAVFFFDFGEKQLLKVRKGDLKNFKCYLDGNVDIDLLLEYHTLKQYEFAEKEISRKNILPTFSAKFMVGTIPVYVTLDTDLGTSITLDCEGEVTATAGFNMSSGAHFGLEYIKGKGIEPYQDFHHNFTLYDPTFNIQASLGSSTAFFPRLNFKLYDCLGPWFDLIPYIKSEMEAGFQASLFGNNYCSWVARIYSGMDTTIGLNLDMGIFEVEAIEPIDLDGDQVLLCQAPYVISLSHPDNEYKMEVNEEVEVAFHVEAHNFLMDTDSDCKGAIVQFETEGKVGHEFGITDENGIVKIKWAPLHTSDRLLAKIVDKEGNTLSEAIFDPDVRVPVPEILKVIYQQTNGDNWTNNDGWMTDTPVEEWYGVHYKDGKFSLDLSGNNLTGYINLNAENDEEEFTNETTDTSDILKNLDRSILTSLVCSNNHLTSLDVSGCSSLEYLRCENNELTTINVSNATALWDLGFHGNPLTSLNASGCTNLGSFLNIFELPLKSLNVSGCTNLKDIYHVDGQLTSINASGCTALQYLDCPNNQLASLDISGCNNLISLNCENNQLTSLNISGRNVLINLNCENNQLTSLDISGCTALKFLECANNQLTSLDISKCTSLEHFNCSYNQLTELSLKNSNVLSYFNCRYNQLNYLNISGNTALTYLYCGYNPFKTLDVSKCTALETFHDFDVSDDDSPSWGFLNLSGCTALISVSFRHYHQKVNTLNVSGCTKLERLLCSSIELKSLDASGCKELFELDCELNPQLTSLALSGCTNLMNLYCRDTGLSGEITSFRSQFQDLLLFKYDIRYTDYKWKEIKNSDGSTDYVLESWKDNGKGWWYSGEPEKGYHGEY